MAELSDEADRQMIVSFMDARSSFMSRNATAYCEEGKPTIPREESKRL